jgi:hypothetical protein
MTHIAADEESGPECRDGAAAGAIGFATIALTFVVTDALAGRPLLYTPPCWVVRSSTA